MLGEEDGRRPLLGAGQLGKEDAGHAGLDDDPEDGLEALEDDCVPAPVAAPPQTVAWAPGEKASVSHRSCAGSPRCTGRWT